MDGFYFTKYSANFNYCYAWDNMGNGFQMHILTNINLSHSASWNNGNANVFTGKYDYDNRKPLDKNMMTIQDLIKSDVDFEKNYNDRKFSIENGKINGINAKEWIARANLRQIDGFGFSTDALTKDVTCKYDVSFDNKCFGINDKYSQVCPARISNCVSFNNNINYHLTYKFSEWVNNWSWNAIENEQNDMNENIKTPKNINISIKSFYSVRDEIINAVYENKFPDNINFDESIKDLIE